MTKANAIKKLKSIIKKAKLDEGELRCAIRHIFIDMKGE